VGKECKFSPGERSSSTTRDSNTVRGKKGQGGEERKVSFKTKGKWPEQRNGVSYESRKAAY